MNSSGLLLITFGVWLTCQVLIAKPSIISIIEAYR
jgi:hypothetical protein